MPTTAADALRAQFEIMLTQARRADERGYMVLLHHLNPDANDYGFLYGSFNAALTRFLEDRRAHGRGRRIAIVHVWPEKDAVLTGKPFDGVLSFSIELPRSREYRPLCDALGLMSARMIRIEGSKRTREKRGTGIFTWTEKSSVHEYSGTGRTALETLLRVLEIPHHRSILIHGEL